MNKEDITEEFCNFVTITRLTVQSTKLLNFDCKITQFWLVESSTINPNLYSVGVPIKFPWKQCIRKKMADSRFAISVALFLPNKGLFTNFVIFNHAWKQEEDSWNDLHCHTKPNSRVATILAWFWWLCHHVNWKLTSFSYSS